MLTKLSMLAGSLVALAFALAPSEAAAKPKAKGAYGKPWRLHFETEFLGVTHFNPDGGDDDPDEKQTNVGFGIARPSVLDDHGALVGGAVFGRPLFGVGFGYAFSKERAIVGGKLALTVDGIDVGDDTNETLVGGRLVPYFQWMFLPGSWVRPYVEVRLGFGGAARVTSDPDDPDVEFTQHFIYPLVGAGGGVHLFPVDYFSVDLGLNFDYVAPHARDTFDGDPPPGEDESWDKLGDLVNFGVLLGASVWF
jgi:hypothetical protein